MFLKVVFDLYTFSDNLFMTLVYFGLFRLFLQSFSNVFFVYCIAISHLFLTNHCHVGWESRAGRLLLVIIQRDGHGPSGRAADHGSPRGRDPARGVVVS